MPIFAIFLFLFFQSAYSQDQAPSFLEGVNAYEAGNFKKAQELFAPLLAENSENPTLLYNSGLVEFKLGNLGLALGLWRKARSLNPSAIEITNAIGFAENILAPDTPEYGFFYSLYLWLAKIPIHLWLALTFLSFFPALWFAIKYGVKLGHSVTHWPVWIFICIPIFIFSLSLSSLVLVDQMKIKATIIDKDRLVHTGPSETSPTLSELQEGQIVFVEKAHSSWVQIRTADGAPGWIPQTSLISFGGN